MIQAPNRTEKQTQVLPRGITTSFVAGRLAVITPQSECF
jgi:hypothetical protein